MKKKILSVLLAAVTAVSLFAGCGKGAEDNSGDGVTDEAAAEKTSKSEDDGPTLVFIPKSKGDPFIEKQAEGFKKAVSAAGATPLVDYPTSATADAQISIIQALIPLGVDGICIASNDDKALKTALEEARAAGITVCSVDSAVDPISRSVHINQTGTKEIGEALIEAVYDLTEGEGEWAILSASFKATNQNAWIDIMKERMKSDSKYKDMKLVEVAWGDDDPEKSAEQAKSLIESYPDLKVICAPTTVGLPAAAGVLKENGSSVKITGLGLPSEMKDYIGDDEEHPCPYMFLWNPEDLGALGGCTLLKLCEGKITGKAGDTFECELGSFTVESAEDGGTQIILGEPFKFDASNIEEWSKIY